MIEISMISNDFKFHMFTVRWIKRNLRWFIVSLSEIIQDLKVLLKSYSEDPLFLTLSTTQWLLMSPNNCTPNSPYKERKNRKKRVTLFIWWDDRLGI